MRVIETTAEFRRVRKESPVPVGFVPTMGYLHEGHLALVRRARRECKTVVASIFVNPAQFGPTEDFETYPRDMERDLALLKKENVDLVFTPSREELYPEAFQTWINPGGLAGRLEGASRPGFFRGVCTVVNLLFNIVEPHMAYFGQKDAQQLLVVKKMVEDLRMNVEVVAVPTQREADGLAISSRNVYLDDDERRAALVLWKALNVAKKLWEEGERAADRIRAQMTVLIEAEPKASIDYISIADAATLEELEEVAGPALVSLAVRIGSTRLIDNITLDPGAQGA